MRNKVFFIALISILWVTVSCKKYRHEEFGRNLSKAFKSKAYKDFDTTAYYAVFKEQLKKERNTVHHPQWLSKIYTTEDKGLTLIGNFLIGGEIDSLHQYLNESHYHGLNPDYFHAAAIAQLLDTVKNTKFKKVEDTYPLLSKLEILSADGLINYANILKYGIINPKKIHGKYYDAVDRPDFIDSQKALDQLDILAFLRDIQPKSIEYARLQDVLRKSEALEPQHKEKIYLNLERLRWPVKEYPQRHILVNIPEFKLRLIENGKEQQSIKVCVGETAYKPFSRNGKNHETPVLSGKIDRMQVNPVWNIPKSIAGNEIMQSLKRNASYLEENNMVAYNKAGDIVDASAVDWNSASVDDYSFKQNPGVDNSLGRIKFIFYNPYAIYLHDTPAKQMFNEKNRAVSHGCVRVEEPARLVDFLLTDKSEADKVKSEISGESTTSRWVTLKEPVMVYLAYYTARTSENGDLIMVEDVYGKDKALKSALGNRMTKL